MFIEEKYVKLQKIKDYMQGKIDFFADEIVRFKVQNDEKSASLCQLIHGDLTDILTMLNDIDKAEWKDNMTVEELNRITGQKDAYTIGSCDDCEYLSEEVQGISNDDKIIYFGCDKGVKPKNKVKLDKCYFWDKQKEKSNVRI